MKMNDWAIPKVLRKVLAPVIPQDTINFPKIFDEVHERERSNHRKINSILENSSNFSLFYLLCYCDYW